MLPQQRKLSLAALIICLLLSAFQARAQFLSGITGTVHDSSGAIIPNATVTLTDTRLGVTRTATANDAGFFRFDSIAASTYKVDAHQSGFKDWQQPDLTLQVGQLREVSPILTVGDVASTVTVTADDLALNVTNPTTGSVISSTTVHDAPLVGQNVYSLSVLTPGVTGSGVTSGDNYADEYAININANGLRQELNGYQIDGAYTDNPSRGGGTSISPNPEIVESINIETNAFDAGATIDVFTKSGTNKLHGTFDYYFTNDGLSARTEFQQNLPAS